MFVCLFVGSDQLLQPLISCQINAGGTINTVPTSFPSHTGQLFLHLHLFGNFVAPDQVVFVRWNCVARFNMKLHLILHLSRSWDGRREVRLSSSVRLYPHYPPKLTEKLICGLISCVVFVQKAMQPISRFRSLPLRLNLLIFLYICNILTRLYEQINEVQSLYNTSCQHEKRQLSSVGMI